MVGDPRQRSALGGNHPDILVVAVLVLLASAVRYERDARPIGRPLRIGIVPFLARSDLAFFAGGCIDHPNVAALVIEPSGVVELVGNMLVVPNVALAAAGGHLIARPAAADCDESLAIRRPLQHVDTILQM